MTVITEEFDLGRWTEYDTEPSLLDELKARQHVDLRSFSNSTLNVQFTMYLLARAMSELDTMTMSEIEDTTLSRAPESWTNGTIGPDPALGNRNSLRISLAAGQTKVAVSTEVAIELRQELKLYQDAKLSLACPDFPASSLDLDFCSLTLESGPENFVILPFPVGITDGDREISWPIADLEESLIPYTITLTLKATAACTVTIAAMRVMDGNWTPLKLDADTKTQRLVSTVNLDGTIPTEEFVKVWRSAEVPGADDPRPINSRLSVAFYTGMMNGQNSITLFMRGRREDYITQLDLDGTDVDVIPSWGENQASLDARGYQPDFGQAAYNSRAQADLDTQSQLDLNTHMQVEIERTIDTISEAWIQVELRWGDGDNEVNIENTETLADDDFGYSLPCTLVPNTFYLLGVDLEDDEIRVIINELTNESLISDVVFDSTLIRDDYLVKRSRGRVGWDFQLEDGNAYIESVRSRGLMFGEIKTNNFESFTPVDGARLVVGSTPDHEIVPGLESDGIPDPELSHNGAQLALDLHNAKSDDGSIQVTVTPQQGIQSPFIAFEDFRHSYVQFDVYYPGAALASGMLLKAALLNQLGYPIQLTMPLIKGDQWQTIRLRLSRAMLEQSGMYRFLLLQSGGDAVFWIDNLKFQFQNVVWAGRATYNDPWNRDNNRWTEFEGFVNSEDDGVVFPERGFWTQVRGQAITQGATIDKLYIRPKYTELGRLVWNN